MNNAYSRPKCSCAVTRDQDGRLDANVNKHQALLQKRREQRAEKKDAGMIEEFPEEEKVYFSHVMVDDDTTNTYPLDFLNSITPNALPPHELRIKKKLPCDPTSQS
jgi:hypothetical protein